MGFIKHIAALVTLFSTVVLSQLPFSVIPTISDAVKENADQVGARPFVRLWEYALEFDGQGPGPASKINFEAKTILVPGPLAMSNLIPQDTANPLYGNTKGLKTLRRNFLKDHLVLDPIKPTDPNLSKKDGVRALTFSGKDVHIKKDPKGDIFVEDKPVRQFMSLDDGTQIYILDDVLFDNGQKVREVFNTRFASELLGPTGPPLDIDGSGFVPSPGDIGPPGLSQFSQISPAPPGGVAPAQPPPQFSVPRAPAPPPGFAPAPPSGAVPAQPQPQFSVPRAPAPPPGFAPSPPSGAVPAQPQPQFSVPRAPAPPPGFAPSPPSGAVPAQPQPQFSVPRAPAPPPGFAPSPPSGAVPAQPQPQFSVPRAPAPPPGFAPSPPSGAVPAQPPPQFSVARAHAQPPAPNHAQFSVQSSPSKPPAPPAVDDFIIFPTTPQGKVRRQVQP